MDQMFVVMLSRVSAKDADAPLRELFAELKGCKLLALVQRASYVTVTMAFTDPSTFATDKELRLAVSVLTDRVPHLVRLDEVRAMGVAGALEHVNKILGNKS
jgi:hypothetical protein